VLQLIAAVRANHNFTQAYQAGEFLNNNTPTIRQKFAAALKGIPTTFEPHVEFKKRVPQVIGLIRTGDTVQYANTILISG
jgi:D-ribose pyranase